MARLTDDSGDSPEPYELLGLEGGGVLRTHGLSACRGGGPCVIHRPTDHHMRGWRLIFRTDKYWLAERFCPHGIGHPDPDSLAYFKTLDQNWMGVHGCDGCCKDPHD